MKTKQKETTKIITTIIIATKIILNTIYTQAASISVIPTENQYLELRATTINTMDNQDKQIIFELWGHDIEFKGFEIHIRHKPIHPIKYRNKCRNRRRNRILQI